MKKWGSVSIQNCPTVLFFLRKPSTSYYYPKKRRFTLVFSRGRTDNFPSWLPVRLYPGTISDEFSTRVRTMTFWWMTFKYWIFKNFLKVINRDFWFNNSIPANNLEMVNSVWLFETKFNWTTPRAMCAVESMATQMPKWCVRLSILNFSNQVCWLFLATSVRFNRLNSWRSVIFPCSYKIHCPVPLFAELIN